MPQSGDRPRVLLITRNLPPLVGGMERLMQHMAAGIAQYTRLTVIGPRGCTEHLPKEVEVLETSEKLARFLVFSTWHAIRLCQQRTFDRVIGGSGLIAPTLRILKRLFFTETVIYLHGLDLVVDSLSYQRVFVPCIGGIDHVIVNSRNTRRLAIEKGVEESRIAVVNPGTDLPNPPDEIALQRFRAKFNIPFEKIMIFVGRITRRKGLSKFLEHSLPEILAVEPGAGLVIVGKNPEHSLNRLGEEKKVFSLASRHEYKDRILFLGQLSDSDLQACYALADVQIFPVMDIPGDVEGFGMVAIEAAALGTPTVAFDVGGVADAISKDNGQLIPGENYDAFTRGILKVLRNKFPWQEKCVSHAQKYSWNRFDDDLRRVVMRHATDQFS